MIKPNHGPAEFTFLATLIKFMLVSSPAEFKFLDTLIKISGQSQLHVRDQKPEKYNCQLINNSMPLDEGRYYTLKQNVLHLKSLRGRLTSTKMDEHFNSFITRRTKHFTQNNIHLCMITANHGFPRVVQSNNGQM